MDKKCLNCKYYICTTSSILDLDVKVFNGYCKKDHKDIDSDCICELWEIHKYKIERRVIS